MDKNPTENNETHAQQTNAKKSSVKYFFIRDYTDKAKNPDADLSRLSESRFTAPFNMKEMHAVQKEYLESRNKLIDCIERPEKLSDFLADVVATAHAKSVFGSEEQKIAREIGMYTGALYEHGYNQKDYSSFYQTVIDYLGEKGILVWIIAGTQDEYLVEQRAKAAVEAFNGIRTKGKEIRHFIAFCGAHPPTDRVDLSNEAFILKCSFTRQTDVVESPINAFFEGKSQYALIEENKSRNTEENIEKAMCMFFSSKIEDTASDTETNRKYGVIIVSNDFHLIRLSRDFRKYRRNKDITKKEVDNKLNFAALFLLGSEYFNVDATQQCRKNSAGGRLGSHLKS